MHARARRFFAIVALSVASSGCGERTNVTSPAVAGSTAYRTVLESPTSVHVVTRNTPLAQSLSASAVIGAFGGTLSIPGAGLTVVVPAFALTSPTQVTVTAVAGSQVAYEFEPHGTQFLVPLVVTQSLVGTSAANAGILPPSLVAGYFASLSDLNPTAGTALISELLGTALSADNMTTTFSVLHFSGYLIATGNESAPDDGSPH